MCACLLLAALGGVLWKQVLRDRLVVKRWGVVESGKIYRSGQISSHLVKDVLQKHEIGVVVDLTGDDPENRDQPAERLAISQLGIDLVRCPLIGDGTGDVSEYVRAVEAIVRARSEQKPVLVHCYAGAQRTGGVVAAYRMLVEQAPPAAVRKELEGFGWNPSKDGILIDYLNSNLEELARQLADRGAIDRIPDPLPQLPTR